MYLIIKFPNPWFCSSISYSFIKKKKKKQTNKNPKHFLINFPYLIIYIKKKKLEN